MNKEACIVIGGLVLIVALFLKCQSDCQKLTCPNGMSSKYARGIGCVCLVEPK